jgi:acetyl-CoA synthetase
MTCAEAFLSDPNYGALIYAYPYAYAAATERLPRLDRLAEQYGKPVCIVWLTQYLEGPGADVTERSPHLAMFRSMDRCFTALAAWHAQAEAENSAVVGDEVREANERRPLGQWPAQASVLDERHTKALLAAYGVTVPKEMLVDDAESAARAAMTVGGRVVLKIASPDIAHKSDVGGVMLGIEGAEAAREAFLAIIASCAEAHPEAKIDGVIVQAMMPAGVEIIVGVKNDPAFGPIVVIGLGGVLTELLRDTVSALAPIDERRALNLLTRLRGTRLLDGFRGFPAVDRAALAWTISRISRLAHDHRDRLLELDVNPLICRGELIVAVDGLTVLRPPDSRSESLSDPPERS